MRVLLKTTGEGSQFSAVFEVGEVEMYSLFQTLPQRTANIIPILTILSIVSYTVENRRKKE